MPDDPNYPGMSEDESSPSKTANSPEKEKKDDEGETALLPKSFFEGQELKPGDQFYVEIVRSYEDEVLVKYPHKTKEESKGNEAHSKLEDMGTEMGGGY